MIESQQAAEIARLWLKPGSGSWAPTAQEFAKRLMGGGLPYKSADTTPLRRTYAKTWNLTQDFLDSVTADLGADPSIVVEVGSLYGDSARLISETWPSALVVCVDTWLGDVNMSTMQMFADDFQRIDPSAFAKFLRNTERHPNVIPFRRSSIVALRLFHLLGLRVDAIYLDSAHEEGETLLELEAAWRLLRPCGVLFGDDYGSFPGVTHDVGRFMDARPSAGIAINDRTIYKIQKPADA